MMQKKRTAVWSLVIGLGLLIVGLVWKGPYVSAMNHQELPPGFVIGDQTGLFATSTGDYFVDIEKLVPGSSFKKEITIRNTEKDKPYDLSLKIMNYEQKGPLNLGEAIKVTLKDGQKVLYDGPIIGTKEMDWRVVPLKIGKFSYGEDKVLTATFTLAKELTVTDFKEATEAKLTWQFIAVKDKKGEIPVYPKEEATRKSGDNRSGLTGWLPQTGEEWESFLYKLCAGLFLILIALMLIKKKKWDKQVGVEREDEKSSELE